MGEDYLCSKCENASHSFCSLKSGIFVAQKECKKFQPKGTSVDVTDVFDNRRQDEEFLHWFLIASITGEPITEEMKANPKILEMAINGEKINPVRAIKRLEEDFDRMVENRAKALVDEIQGQIYNAVNDGLCVARREIDKVLENNGD